MNLGQAKQKVIDLIRERSNAGVLIPDGGNNQDYFLTMNSYFNEAQIEIATTNKKVNDSFSITQNPVLSSTGIQGFNLSRHVGGVDKEFIGSAVTGIYFELDKTHTAYIEEEINGVWTIIDTINGVYTSGVGFTAYKRLISALSITDPTNMFRLRLSGPYAYNYRNIGLFTDAFATIEEVPDYTPYTFYDTPSDFFEIQEIAHTYDYQKYEIFGNYRYADTADKGVQIAIPYNISGEFEVRYFKYPRPFTIDYENPTIDDALTFDIDDDAVEAAIYKVASLVKVDEDPYLSSKLEQSYFIKLNNLQSKENQGLETIYDQNGWC